MHFIRNSTLNLVLLITDVLKLLPKLKFNLIIDKIFFNVHNAVLNALNVWLTYLGLLQHKEMTFNFRREICSPPAAEFY